MMHDDRDEALLAALERNARASVVALARTIGLSRSATQERLARLERSGAIRGYTVERGEPNVGGTIAALLMVRHDTPGGCARLVPAIRTIPEVTTIDALAGDPDMIVRVGALHPADLDRIADRIRALPGVTGLSTHLVLASHRAGITD